MGMYTRLHTKIKCEDCQEWIEVVIQFKFGATWLYNYNLGDKIDWQGGEDGVPDLPLAKAHGYAEDTEGDALICFNCLHIQPSDEFDVFFEHDVIKSVAFLKDVRDYYARRKDGFEEYKGWAAL